MMTRETIQDLLKQLKDAILREREHARQIDLYAMTMDMQEKEALIQLLNNIGELHPDDRHLAREIQNENRRNAFLFKSTLNWIQDTMEFFGRKAVPATYGYSGKTVNSSVNGRLLSGKI
jgi:flagellar biosynthesis/type III secretory pathway chaperone